MKKLLKYTSYSLLTLVTLVILYLCSAWTLSRLTVKAEPNTTPDISIYLKTNGVHADLILPVKTVFKDWSEDIPYTNTRSGDTTMAYIAFGWGDKGFYLETPTWNDLKASTAFNAAFGLSTSAMHATFYHQLQEGERCIKLDISNEQYQRLVTYIGHSFQTDVTGKPIVIPTEARYGQYDAFYEAKGTYSLFHTCNTWANNALKVSGQKACVWTPFDTGIFYQHRK
ncbi:MAG: TIGR02117 family protein [Niastella sp.]|nr:TIGR02117 family protein [Niastella sp.]